MHRERLCDDHQLSVAKAALFLDRDGTIIADAHYPSDPEQVTLLPGAAAAIARVNAVRIPVVIITNQSGIGRGHITDAQYQLVRTRVETVLQAEGATITATYHCPHWPERDGPCACRKPGIGMHTQAARDLGLSLPASVYVGDRFRDVQPARVAGGLGILVPGAETPMDDVQQAKQAQSAGMRVADDITAAVEMAMQWFAANGAVPAREL